MGSGKALCLPKMGAQKRRVEICEVQSSDFRDKQAYRGDRAGLPEDVSSGQSSSHRLALKGRDLRV